MSDGEAALRAWVRSLLDRNALAPRPTTWALMVARSTIPRAWARPVADREEVLRAAEVDVVTSILLAVETAFPWSAVSNEGTRDDAESIARRIAMLGEGECARLVLAWRDLHPAPLCDAVRQGCEQASRAVCEEARGRRMGRDAGPPSR